MESSFGDLVMTSLIMKMIFQSNKLFERQIFLNIQISTLNAKDVSGLFIQCMYVKWTKNIHTKWTKQLSFLTHTNPRIEG
jgi:hypothetical protein